MTTEAAKLTPVVIYDSGAVAANVGVPVVIYDTSGNEVGGLVFYEGDLVSYEGEAVYA